MDPWPLVLFLLATLLLYKKTLTSPSIPVFGTKSREMPIFTGARVELASLLITQQTKMDQLESSILKSLTMPPSEMEMKALLSVMEPVAQ